MKYLPLLAIGLMAAPAFADDVNVPARPLANETAIPGKVDVRLSCAVQPDKSLTDCQLADGARGTKHDINEAITYIQAHGQFPRALSTDGRTTIVVTLNVGHAMPLIAVR